jgi:hypothetical protein
MGRRRFMVAALILVTAGGCATGGSRAGQGRPTIVVDNDVTPPTAVTVYVVDEFDNRRLLGNLNPLELQAFTVTPNSTGQYQLMARTTAGSEVVSRRFTLLAGETAQWRLSVNVVDH